MSIAALIEIYVALALGALCGWGIYSEMRRRRFGPTHTEDRIFCCQTCGYVYTDDADVIAPSRVQVLVDAIGDVVSAVLLPPDDSEAAASHYDAADQRALELARAMRFAPSSCLTVGRMFFYWHTVPPPATNSPAASP